MTIQRMDNVLIVVDDLDAATAFFAELGVELEGEATNDGPLGGQHVGLDGVRADIAGELAQYEDSYRLCFLRGPEGISIGVAEKIG